MAQVWNGKRPHEHWVPRAGSEIDISEEGGAEECKRRVRPFVAQRARAVEELDGAQPDARRAHEFAKVVYLALGHLAQLRRAQRRF